MKLYQGDCLQVMDKLIKDGVKVDAIITDPPYNISKPNNFKTMGRNGIDFGEWDFNFDLYSWVDKGVKLLSKNGGMIIFNDWKNIGNIGHYAELQGMEIKDMLRWIKKNPMPRNAERRYVVDYEVAIWLVKKNGNWVFNKNASNGFERPCFESSLTSGFEKTIHPTQKPITLMEDILQIHTDENQIVLDPFMGSGSTGVAARNLNRDFIGIELDEKYFKIAESRIGLARHKKKLFEVEND